MSSPANLPYQWKLADFTIRDPGSAGNIGMQQKGFASCPIRTGGAEARTVVAPDGDDQFLKLLFDVDGGDATITVLDSAGSTTDTIVFDTAGDTVLMSSIKYGTVYRWVVVGSNIGVLAAGFTTQAAYTQTYSTADRTHANLTSAAFTYPGSGNLFDAVANDLLINVRTDSVANAVADVVINEKSLADNVNQVIVDLTDLKQLVNAVIDDLQAAGISG